jgi:hypothetical protein
VLKHDDRRRRILPQFGVKPPQDPNDAAYRSRTFPAAKENIMFVIKGVGFAIEKNLPGSPTPGGHSLRELTGYLLCSGVLSLGLYKDDTLLWFAHLALEENRPPRTNPAKRPGEAIQRTYLIGASTALATSRKVNLGRFIAI